MVIKIDPQYNDPLRDQPQPVVITEVRNSEFFNDFLMINPVAIELSKGSLYVGS